MNSQWGHCMHCRYFASPARVPLENEEARCDHPELSRYTLTVFGTNGCTGFELRAGLSEEVEMPNEAAPPDERPEDRASTRRYTVSP